MSTTAGQVHVDKFDGTPRSAKRRRLGPKEDGFSPARHAAHVSPTVVVKKAKSKLKDEPVSLSQMLKSNGDIDDKEDDASPQDTQRASTKEKAVRGSEDGSAQKRAKNRMVRSTSGGRGSKSSTPTNVRLSDLIPKEDSRMGDVIVVASPSSTRQSGRERRKPRRYSGEMLPVEKADLINGSRNGDDKRGGRRKTVTFDDGTTDDVDDQIGFRDISTLAKRKRQMSPVLGLNGIDDTIDVVRELLQEETTPKRKRGRPKKESNGQKSIVRENGIAETARLEVSPELDDITLGQKEDETDALFSRLLQDEGAEEVFSSMKKIVLEKITGRRRLQLIGFEEEYKRVHQTVSQTILAGEGNSLLVIGARGSAKTTLVETVVSDLSVDHGTEFHVIRLNGFVHTDDKLALREIWRQLGREMEVDDEGIGQTTNHADILSSLLALLSHPSELSDNQNVSLEETAKAVIFILDEFHLFASHPRQTLLYNLFDIAQARKAPVAVLGVTTKVDVVECLEKRVKSRFSHRYVHCSLPKSLDGFWEICKQGITITEQEADEVYGRSRPGLFTARIKEERDLVSTWNRSVQDLHRTSPTVERLLQITYTRTKSSKDFLTNTLLLPVLSLSLQNPNLQFHILPSSQLTPPDNNTHLLPSLTDLQLALLIAAARLEIIFSSSAQTATDSSSSCTFAMVYDEYLTLAGRARHHQSSSLISSTTTTVPGGASRVWGKRVAQTAWEKLIDYGLVLPATGTTGMSSTITTTTGSWRVDVALEEIEPGVPGLNAVMARWCREI